MAVTDALIDVDTYRNYAGIDSGNEELDEESIEQYIKQATAMIETHCNRLFLTPASAITEIFDGDGAKDYYVRNGNLTATPSAVEYWGGTSWTATAGTFTYGASDGRVYFTDGNKFTAGVDNWRVTYLYGSTQALLSKDVGLACAMTVQSLRQFAERAGISSITVGSQTITLDLMQLPKRVTQILAKHVRPHY